MPRLLLLLAGLVLAACDTDGPGPAPGPTTFQGVEVEAEGDATLAVEGGALVVSGLGGTREGGFVVDGTPDRVDVQIDPLAVPAGTRFGVEVRDGDDVVTALYNEGVGDGRVDLRFDFPGLLGVTAAAVRYKFGGQVVFEARLGFEAGRARGQRRETSAGTGEGDTGSTHVIRDRGRYIVVSDSDGDGGRRAGGCAGFRMTPPPPFDVELDAPICADWVEVEPILTTQVPRGTIAVRGRGVGSFRVRELASQ
ncbi:hypothetical protein [Rubrivirga marina]|nr:hypothetical protein [Rubrivirga marina]